MNGMMQGSKVFFYDGECRFCRKLALRLRKLNRSPALSFHSFRKFQTAELKAIHPSLTDEILEGEVQLIFNNKRYPGFFAVRKILPSLRYFWIFTPLLYLPLIPFLGMFIMVILKKIKSMNT